MSVSMSTIYAIVFYFKLWLLGIKKIDTFGQLMSFFCIT